MNDCKYTITEERNDVKATGISASDGKAEISGDYDCRRIQVQNECEQD